jgi:hypothetical protein
MAGKTAKTSIFLKRARCKVATISKADGVCHENSAVLTVSAKLLAASDGARELERRAKKEGERINSGRKEKKSKGLYPAV